MQLERAIAAQNVKIDQLMQHVIQQGNWIGQLLYRSQDEIDRAKMEAEARFLAPEFTPLEIALLDRWEINTEPLKEAAKPASFPTDISMKPNVLAADGPWHVYVTGDLQKQPPGTPRRQVRVDATLPLLKLSIRDAHEAYPTIEADLPKNSEPTNLNTEVHYEFDTSPTFDGPNFWRYPTLMPAVDSVDLTSTRGINYHVFRTTLADYRPTRSFRFPFRISAMAYQLPEGGARGGDLQKTALLLQHGLSKLDSIREVFNYVRHKYVWGGNATEINALDTFRAGVAGCGHINELMGALLEAKGIRSRAVSGFHPIFRVWNPGGGHTAAEVHDGEAWSFIDTFLAVYFPGVSADDFATSPMGLHPAAAVDHSFERDSSGILAKTFGDRLSLRDLFKYRRYADKQMRLPVAHMMRLRAAAARNLPYPTEETYGLSWPLRVTDVHFDPDFDLPVTADVYVRARYIQSTCEVRGYAEPPCIDPDAIASEWTVTRVPIKPRELVRAAARNN